MPSIVITAILCATAIVLSLVRAKVALVRDAREHARDIEEEWEAAMASHADKELQRDRRLEVIEKRLSTIETSISLGQARMRG